VYLSKVELERALVEAEQESEIAAFQQEKYALEALHNKMADLKTKSQQEKDKVFNRLRLIVKQRETRQDAQSLTQRPQAERVDHQTTRLMMRRLQSDCISLLKGWKVISSRVQSGGTQVLHTKYNNSLPLMFGCENTHTPLRLSYM